MITMLTNLENGLLIFSHSVLFIPIFLTSFVCTRGPWTWNNDETPGKDDFQAKFIFQNYLTFNISKCNVNIHGIKYQYQAFNFNPMISINFSNCTLRLRFKALVWKLHQQTTPQPNRSRVFGLCHGSNPHGDLVQVRGLQKNAFGKYSTEPFIRF